MPISPTEAKPSKLTLGTLALNFLTAKERARNTNSDFFVYKEFLKRLVNESLIDTATLGEIFSQISTKQNNEKLSKKIQSWALSNKPSEITTGALLKNFNHSLELIENTLMRQLNQKFEDDSLTIPDSFLNIVSESLDDFKNNIHKEIETKLENSSSVTLESFLHTVFEALNHFDKSLHQEIGTKLEKSAEKPPEGFLTTVFELSHNLQGLFYHQILQSYLSAKGHTLSDGFLNNLIITMQKYENLKANEENTPDLKDFKSARKALNKRLEELIYANQYLSPELLKTLCKTECMSDDKAVEKKIGKAIEKFFTSKKLNKHVPEIVILEEPSPLDNFDIPTHIFSS